MRLIDADALGNRMYHEVFEKDSEDQKWDSGCWMRYKLFERVLRDAPTIEPERKKGKRIDDCECSSCHWINEDDEGHVLLTYYNFCPNCGEPMENGEKDEQF